MFVQSGFHGCNYLRVGRKTATFQWFSQYREQVVVRQGHIRRIWWVIKELEAQVGQFLLGCKCPVSRGVVVQEQDHVSSRFFCQNGVNFIRRIVLQETKYLMIVRFSMLLKSRAAPDKLPFSPCNK
jgi:hypothetical protein